MTEPSRHARECAKLIEDSLMVYPLGVEKGLRMFSVLGAVQDCLDAATADLREEVERLRGVVAERNAVGEGYRLLEVGERLQPGDEILWHGNWMYSDNAQTSGRTMPGKIYRRKI